jgi:Lamin Tail Domain
MYNPQSVEDSQGEWIELYNPSKTDSLSILNWTLADSGGHVHKVRNDLQVGPQDYLVLANNNGTITSNGGVIVDYAYDPDDLYLANYMEYGKVNGLYLYNEQNELVDWIEWGLDTGLYAAEAGVSLSRVAVNETRPDLMGWCISSNEFALSGGDIGTPGGPNHCESNKTSLHLSLVHLQQKYVQSKMAVHIHSSMD